MVRTSASFSLRVSDNISQDGISYVTLLTWGKDVVCLLAFDRQNMHATILRIMIIFFKIVIKIFYKILIYIRRDIPSKSKFLTARCRDMMKGD